MTVHKEMVDYYQGLFSKHKGIPPRASVNPLHLKKILSWVLLLEWRGPRYVVPTVVGSAIDEAMGSNFTGVNMFDYYPEAVQAAHETYYLTILTHPCGGYLERNVSKKNGAVGTLEALMFPLKDQQGQVNRLIGSMFFTNKELPQPHIPDKRTFTHMSVSKIEYRDIGYGVPGV